MHSYLRTIGFSKITNRVTLNKVLDSIIMDPTAKRLVQVNDIVYTEMSMEVADGIGITLRGEVDKNNNFYMDHYFPYLIGKSISAKEEVSINKKVDTEAYTGMCDDYRLGVSLIFYLQNVIEYLDKKNSNKLLKIPLSISLSALSLEGKILLPIEKDEVHVKNLTAEKKYRNKLIAEAKKGNQDAIDSLTIDDIDTYAMVSKRAKKEDIYSIVDTCFIPYGSESDNYSVIATILDSNLIVNSYTKEELYELHVICNDISFNILINREDLLGEPLPGRRFKGNIWLQGKINFNN
ncbi:MAG: DUF3881 family protein [Clostridiales bacterium]|nr:DUF3881 family protein [Clostridiales bacterium]